MDRAWDSKEREDSKPTARTAIRIQTDPHPTIEANQDTLNKKRRKTMRHKGNSAGLLNVHGEIHGHEC